MNFAERYGSFLHIIHGKYIKSNPSEKAVKCKTGTPGASFALLG